MHERIIGLYESNADGWKRDRGDQLGVNDQMAIGRLTAGLSPGATILDVGCGNGRPVGEALLRLGFKVTGVDSSPSLIAQARTLSGGEWKVGDMRELALNRRFDAVLGWYSLFHLSPEDQRETLPRMIAHLNPGGRIVFASGPVAGVQISEWRGEPLYHGSLSPDEYRAILRAGGCTVEQYREGQSVGTNPTLWMAVRAG